MSTNLSSDLQYLLKEETVLSPERGMTTAVSSNDSLIIVDSTLFFYQDLLSLQVKPDDILANESWSFISNSSDNDTEISDDPWLLGIPYARSGYTRLAIILLSFFLTCIMILIVIGNMLVCIAISTEKSLKTVQNWFIASLAVSDLLLGLMIMPFSLAGELMGYWVFGKVWCEVHHALDVLLCTASINNLCLISLDRYWSITQAVQYLKKRTPARAIVYILFVWCFSALVSLPPLLGWKGKEEELQCNLSDEAGYVVYSSVGSFFAPCACMIFVYAKIFMVSRQRARRALKKKKLPQAPSETTTAAATVVAVTDPSKDKSTTTCTSLSNPSPPDQNRNNEQESGSRRVTIAPTTTRQLPSIIVASSQRQPPPTSISPAALMAPEIVVESSSTPHTSPIRTSDKKVSLEEKCVSFQTPSPPSSRHTRTRPPHVSVETKFVSDDIEEPGSPVGSPVAKGTRGFLSPTSALSKFKASPYGSTLSIADFEDSDMTEQESSDTKKSKGGTQSIAATPRLATSEAERHKRKVAKARERRATFILGLIMASFVGAWLPFFTMYLIQGICKECEVPPPIFTFAFWLGYCNSAINPIIYTVFNRDFRKAFRKILFR